jgi:hypothetical protein
MWCRRILRFSVLAVVFGLAASIALSAQNTHRRGRKYKPPPPTTRIEVTIVRNDDGKPIDDAAVIFHLIGDKGNMELKSNEDGKSMIDVLPTGSKVLLQVIAHGYQTYGGEYDLDKPEMAIKVKLKRPGQQYSIYDNHEQTADDGKSQDKDKTTDDGKAAPAKDADKEKPSESAKQDKTQSGSSQPQ